MTTKAEGSNLWRFVWDHENRLTNASKRKERVDYKYDALGRRVETSGFIRGVTKYTYDGLDVIQDDDSRDGVTKYQNGLGIDNKLSLTNGSNKSYFLSDHLGSTNGLTNSTGAITSQTSYDSFGNPTGNLNTRYQFTGREKDDVTDLYDYRARQYDSKLGRFISEDPIGFAGGDVNLYGYVWNNPIMYKDPLGLYPHGCDEKCQEDVEKMKTIFNNTVMQMNQQNRRLSTTGSLGGYYNNFVSSANYFINLGSQSVFGVTSVPEFEGCIWQSSELSKRFSNQKFNNFWNFSTGHDFYLYENVDPNNLNWTNHKWTKVSPIGNSKLPTMRFDPWKNEWEFLD